MTRQCRFVFIIEVNIYLIENLVYLCVFIARFSSFLSEFCEYLILREFSSIDMTTLPRTNRSSKQSPLSPPFSSPRKLQEMALNCTEGHDSTVASGVSLKQYEEQLNSLRKDNFHLKLRVYFLEEKLGSGATPAVQGLLEHNVRLQVEVEELKRQLTDKQELLAAAAEAIDVLEHQGSLSSDSLEIKNSTSENVLDSQCGDKEDYKTNNNVSPQKNEPASSENNQHTQSMNMEDVLKLKKENKKALNVIKDCMKRIHMQNKEINKLILDKEMIHAQIDNSQIQKYVEMLKSKDEKIIEMENKLHKLQDATKRQNLESEGNLQQMLTRRLQGLAYFLDKLLAHKCVLSEDKKKLARSILEQSLSLPVGLELDESLAPEEFALDESNFDVSQLMNIEDITMMFGHHNICDESVSNSNVNREVKPGFMLNPAVHRNNDKRLFPNSSFSDNVNSKDFELNSLNQLQRRHSNDDKNAVVESDIVQEMCDLKRQFETLKKENNCTVKNLEFANIQINDLNVENDNLRKQLSSETTKVEQHSKEIQSLKDNELKSQLKIMELEKQLNESVKLVKNIQSEKQEMENAFLETERSLKRAADEAAVQASTAALERARAQHDKIRAERELEEVREKLVAALDVNAQLEIEITHQASLHDQVEFINEPQMSDDERPMSPDQGIDSDRLSSLDHNDAVQLSPRSLYEENINLKQKLARTKVTLAETLAQLNAANMRKRSVQRAICREIHKTHGVLRKAREKLEKQDQ